MTTTGQFDLVGQMEKRLNKATEERNHCQQLAKTLDQKLRQLMQKAPRRPNISAEQIDEEISRLEFRRNTTSISLNAEKQLLKEIDSLKAKKTSLKDYLSVQSAIDELKSQRAETIARGRSTEDAVSDLSTGLKKLKLAESAGCDAKDLVTIQVSVPESKFGAIIGKSGANLKQVETDCKVCIDMDKPNQVMRITGSAGGCARAQSAVEEITCAIEETIGLHPDAQGVLLNRRAYLLQEFKDKYGVRIDMHRADGTACLRGAPGKVAIVKGIIEALSKGKADLDVAPRMFPVIIGKGGSTIERLIKESGATIELDRHLEQVRIRGTEESVKCAAELVEKLVKENEEHTKEFDVESSFISFLIEDKGVEMKKMRADSNVMIDINRDKCVLKVRGTVSQLAQFEIVLRRTIDAYEKSLTKMCVDKHIISAVIGKGGSTIKKLSSSSGAKIDIDRDNMEVLLRGNPQDVATVRQEIEEIIRCNHRFVMKSSDEVIAALLSKNREELNRIQQEAQGCTLSVLRREGEVILTGTPEQVSAGKKCLFQFFLKNLSETIDVDDDEIGNVIGPGGSVIKQIQEESGATINIDKQASCITFRGSKDQIEKAKATVLQITRGSGNGDNELMKVDIDAIPTIIGKGGAMIKRLRNDFSVKMDIYRGRGSVRIKGEPEDVAKCKEAIEKLLNETTIVETMEIPVERTRHIFSPNASAIFFETEVMAGSKISLNQNDRKIVIRGPAGRVGVAKRRIQMIVEDHFVQTLELCEEHVAKLVGHGDLNVQRIRDQTGASIVLDESENTVTFSGKMDAVIPARDALERVLQFFCPSHFTERELPRSFICTLFAKKNDILDAASKAQPKESNVGLNMSINVAQNSVKVFGGSSALASAAMDKVVESLELHSKEYAEIEVATAMLSYLVGKKGATINKVSTESGATIDLDSTSGLAKIQGKEENVKKAKKMIHELIAKYQSENCVLDIDPADISQLIGKGGETIRRIQEESNASVNISRDSGSIRIHSPNPEAIESAKELIQKIVGNSSKISIPAPAYTIPSVIGKGGSKIRELQSEFGVSFDLDRQTETILIRGSIDKLPAARAAVERIIEAVPKPSNPIDSEQRVSSKKTVQPLSKTKEVQESEPVDDVTAQFKAVPVGADPTIARKLSKSQKKRAKKKQLEDSANSDVFQMLVGSGTSPAAPIAAAPMTPALEVGALLCGDKVTKPNDSYYHSSSGYTLRL